jgi:hypothetical protein
MLPFKITRNDVCTTNCVDFPYQINCGTKDCSYLFLSRIGWIDGFICPICDVENVNAQINIEELFKKFPKLKPERRGELNGFVQDRTVQIESSSGVECALLE